MSDETKPKVRLKATLTATLEYDADPADYDGANQTPEKMAGEDADEWGQDPQNLLTVLDNPEIGDVVTFQVAVEVADAK